MSDAILQILFSKQNSRFNRIQDISKTVSTLYSGNPMIRDSIFVVVQNYARKNDIPLDTLRFPFHDDELWAFTFLKKGTIFICINSGLSLCKQFFAAAHELYHVYCFGEDVDQNKIRNGSLLKGETEDEIIAQQEELEANAFAGLTLMPSTAVKEQMELLGINERQISLDDVLVMMDVFAVPYRACVLRLYECGVIGENKARALYDIDWKEVQGRISLTGKAKRWQLDGTGTEIFGTLFDDFAFNTKNDFLTESREKSDRAFISSLKDRYDLDVEGI